jgi:arginine N-succinyltransferase
MNTLEVRPLPGLPVTCAGAEPAAADAAEHLAVLATDTTGQPLPLATLRLVRAIGLDLPRVSWHVGCAVHASAELRLHHRQLTLLLGHDHTGASELADIAWAGEGLPLPVHAAALQLLLRAALLRVAADRHRYAPRLVVELPGLRDAQGRAPFWEGLGRHFYGGDPAAAAARHGPAWPSLVASLLPRQLVYASFLPAAAQAAIAQAAPTARLLREVLEEAGLRYGHHVAVADAGPILEAETDQLPGVAQARRLRLEAAQGALAGAAPWLVMLPAEEAAAPAAPWRVLRAYGAALPAAPGALTLTAPSAQALGALPPQRVWAVPL